LNVRAAGPHNEAIAWLAKEIPKSEHCVKQVQAGARRITDAAENGGPMIFAKIGMMRAINRHRVPDRRLVQAAPLGEAKS
jgi:hypothetical protein